MSVLSRICYVVLSTLARILPPSISYLIGETLAVVCFLLCTGRRRNLTSNLRIVLGDSNLSGLSRVVFRVMLNFGRGVTEVFMIPHLSDKHLLANTTIEGRERLDSIVSAGRGVILVTAHLGSWELGGAALAAMGYKITTVAGTQFTRSLSPHIKAMKRARGIEVVSAEGGTLSIVRALRRGEAVALHIDGDQYLGGITTDFFGRKTVLPRGPAGLAIKTGAAIIPAFAIRTARGKITVRIEEEIPVHGPDENILTASVAAVVEDRIRRYADQWCMFRLIWENAQ
ncbi:MAG: lysophospholipid acyltransferase family protein [Candidatus Eisenbacteria bacterium]